MSSSRKRGSDSRWSLPSTPIEGGNDTTILFAGIGPSNAARALRQSLAERRYRLVVSAGFSGGTRPGLKVGDLVLASEVLEISSGKRWTPEPVLSRPFVLSPRSSRGQALSKDERTNVSVGRLATVDRPLSDPQEKDNLGRTHGVLAVDMETAAVAAAASEAGVPWVALRAILDPMEVRLTVGSLRQGLGFLANPFRWRQLTQFMESVRVARGSLSNGLRSLVSQCHPHERCHPRESEDRFPLEFTLERHRGRE